VIALLQLAADIYFPSLYNLYLVKEQPSCFLFVDDDVQYAEILHPEPVHIGGVEVQVNGFIGMASHYLLYQSGLAATAYAGDDVGELAMVQMNVFEHLPFESGRVDGG
jgi:hypothetical protein